MPCLFSSFLLCCPGRQRCRCLLLLLSRLVVAHFLVSVKFFEVALLNERTWFAVAALQVVNSMLYNPHISAAYAYTSELSSDPDKQARYNTQLIVVMYTGILLFLVVVLGLAALLGTGDVGTARISQVACAIVSGALFGFAWIYLFRDRPPHVVVDENGGRRGTDNLLWAGFRKVWDTTNRIRTRYTTLLRFMISITFADSALAALVVVSTTYMKQQLGMSSKEIGFVFLVVLVCGIPGSKFGGWISIRFRNPITSAKLCDCYLIVVTTAASLVLTGPSDKNLAILFGGLWGVGLGWLPPMHTTGFISLIPKRQEVELMGMFLLCNQVLSWLPPLVFTVLNESGFPMSYGLASLNIYFFVGFLFLMAMGNYSQAVLDVQQTAEEDGEEAAATTTDATVRPTTTRDDATERVPLT